ncbi:MAG: putative Transposon Ty3-G Gag-Pol polyprotein [Streblomastix strix]|uniref:Putative Transposon Ty3-G Gag-Pol polyprotein n=1 Tax=Streblomastix strix TaxID=222440 RepID=A0A5J4U6W1_9EUKA|nr:MAG: putative Transposon Ty3-G Gag-Pol polyprotein [Streblomastix strix]
MEDQRTLRDNLQHNDLVSTLDLKSTYLHAPMAEELSKYLGFKYNNQYYRQKTLCFGLTSAPHIFTQLMRLIISQLRPKIRTISYIDDFAFMFTTESEAQAGIKEIILLFRKLGLTIEWKKSNLIPSHQFIYLGFDWDTNKMIVSPLKERIQKVTNKVSQRLKLQRRKQRVGAYTIASLIGTLSSLAMCETQTHMRLRHLNKCKDIAVNNGNWSTTTYLDSEAEQELLW